jgi:hypothetical protein
MWHSLPVELQRQCLQCLDVKTLGSFRLASKDTSILATEVLFGTVRLYHPKPNYDIEDADDENETIAESVGKYNNIRKDNSLRLLVRTVVFHTSDPDHDDDDEIGQPERDLDKSYKRALKSASQFSNLREVRLVFSGHCTVDDENSAWTRDLAETVSFRTDVLHAFFEGLNNENYPLEHFDTLTIKNLQDHTSELIYHSPDFIAVLGRVKKLNLCIVTETDDTAPEMDIQMPGCHEMFNTDLCKRWLEPLQGQLTHLSLYTTRCFWGFWPYCDLRTVHFPHLKSLSLGNWTIVHDWQIDWIISHGSTLEELLLDDCSILTAAYLEEEHVATHFPDLEPLHASDDNKVYVKELDLRWRTIFPRFRTGLPKLLHFAIGQGDWRYREMFEERYELAPRLMHDRYHMFDNGIGPSQWVGGGDSWVLSAALNDESGRRGHLLTTGVGQKMYYFPACDEEDMQALVGLMEVVERRASAKC